MFTSESLPLETRGWRFTWGWMLCSDVEFVEEKSKKKTRYNRTMKNRDVGVTTQAKHLKIKPKEWWNSSVVNGKYNPLTLHQTKHPKSSVMEVWNKPLLKLKKKQEKITKRIWENRLASRASTTASTPFQRPGRCGCEKAETGRKPWFLHKLGK